MLTLFAGCSSSAIRTLSSDGGDVGNSGSPKLPEKKVRAFFDEGLALTFQERETKTKSVINELRTKGAQVAAARYCAILGHTGVATTIDDVKDGYILLSIRCHSADQTVLKLAAENPFGRPTARHWTAFSGGYFDMEDLKQDGLTLSISHATGCEALGMLVVLEESKSQVVLSSYQDNSCQAGGETAVTLPATMKGKRLIAASRRGNDKTYNVKYYIGNYFQPEILATLKSEDFTIIGQEYGPDWKSCSITFPGVLDCHN